MQRQSSDKHVVSKTVVAIMAGGYSPEYKISIQSGEVVLKNLDSSKYEAYLVIVREDNWKVRVDGTEVALDLNTFSFEHKGKPKHFDVAFNAIHGAPGETGLLQGYFESRNIRHTSSNTFVSSLTFHKYECNLVLKNLGYTCSPSMLINRNEPYSEKEILDTLKLPLFVKPNNSGSSFGVSKVNNPEDLKEALELAFKEDDNAVAEAFMDGVEVGCGAFMRNGEIVALPLTEIRTENEFFDYEAKYEGKSQEITPAEVSDEIRNEVQKLSAGIYKDINASGVIRVDFIIVGDIPHVIEVNTIPGLSAESIVPQQVQSAGHNLQEFFGWLIEESIR